MYEIQGELIKGIRDLGLGSLNEQEVIDRLVDLKTSNEPAYVSAKIYAADMMRDLGMTGITNREVDENIGFRDRGLLVLYAHEILNKDAQLRLSYELFQMPLVNLGIEEKLDSTNLIQ